MTGTPTKSEVEREAGNPPVSRFWQIAAIFYSITLAMFGVLLLIIPAVFVYGMGEEILPAVNQAGEDFIEWIFS